MVYINWLERPYSVKCSEFPANSARNPSSRHPRTQNISVLSIEQIVNLKVYQNFILQDVLVEFQIPDHVAVTELAVDLADALRIPVLKEGLFVNETSLNPQTQLPGH